MKILNPKTVIADLLETAFNLRTYVEIIGKVASEDFSISDEFMKKYNGYYRVRQKSEIWYDRYYRLLKEQRRRPGPFGHLLREMYR